MKTSPKRNSTDISLIPDDFIYSLMLRLSNSFTGVSSSKLEEACVYLNGKVREFETILSEPKSVKKAGFVLLELCAVMRFEPFKSFAVKLKESYFFPLNGVSRIALRKRLNLHYTDYKKPPIVLVYYFIEKSMQGGRNGEMALANVLSDKQFQKIQEYWKATKRK